MEPQEVIISSKQADFTRATEKHRGFVGGRGAGKSLIGAWDMIKRVKGGRNYMIAAPTYRDLKDSTYKTFRWIAKLVGVFVKDNLSDMVCWVRGIDGGVAEIMLRSGHDPDSFGRGPNLSGIWMDEASLIDEEAYLNVIATLREGGELGWISATFTPKGRRHWTYKTFTEPDAFLVRSGTRENPFLPLGFYKMLRRRYSASRARQELEGEFVDDQNALIPESWLARAQNRFRMPLGPYTAGIDVAYRGRDRNVCVVCGPTGMLCGFELSIGDEPNVMRLAGFVHKLISGDWKWTDEDGTEQKGFPIRAGNVHIDASEGGGESVYARLREQNIRITPERFGARPQTAVSSRTMHRVLAGDLYANRRAELYGTLARRLDPDREDEAGFSIPPGHPDLIDELLAHEDLTDSSGKLRLAPKDEVKKALGRMGDGGVRSPDWSDALVMAAWRSVRRRNVTIERELVLSDVSPTGPVTENLLEYLAGER